MDKCWRKLYFVLIIFKLLKTQLPQELILLVKFKPILDYFSFVRNEKHNFKIRSSFRLLPYCIFSESCSELSFQINSMLRKKPRIIWGTKCFAKQSNVRITHLVIWDHMIWLTKFLFMTHGNFLLSCEGLLLIASG